MGLVDALQGVMIMFALARACRVRFSTVCARGGGGAFTRTVVLVVTLTATNAACRKMAIYAAVPVPLAVVALLGSGSGLKRGHIYPEVEERFYLVDILEFSYLEDFHKEGISGNVSAGGEERSY